VLPAKSSVNVVLPLQVLVEGRLLARTASFVPDSVSHYSQEETAKFPHFVLSTLDGGLFVPGAKCKAVMQLSYRPVGTKPFSSHLCATLYQFTTANLLYEVSVYFWPDFLITRYATTLILDTSMEFFVLCFRQLLITHFSCLCYVTRDEFRGYRSGASFF
jgi:hypothetical protein